MAVRRAALALAVSALAAPTLSTGSSMASPDVDLPIALVQIRNNFYDPATITIPAGTTVVWLARDGGHTVTAVDGSFDTITPLAAGDVFTHTFDARGSFAYRCLVHEPRMSGTVVVE